MPLRLPKTQLPPTRSDASMQSNGTPCSCRALATAMPEEPAPMRQTEGSGADIGAASQKMTEASSFRWQGADDLLGRPLPRPHRAVHVPEPVVRGLGAGEVDPAVARAQVGAVLGQHAGREVAHGTAPRPGLGRPVLLDELERAAGALVGREADEVVQDAGATRGGVQRRPLAVALAADEREEDADAAVG